jgi:hypothetical protein
MKQDLGIYSPIGILVRWSTNTPFSHWGYIYFSCFIYNIIRKRRCFSKAWSETGVVTFAVFLFQNAFFCCKDKHLARDTADKHCLACQQGLSTGGGRIERGCGGADRAPRYAPGAWAILKPAERCGARPGLPMPFNPGSALCGASGAVQQAKKSPPG